MVAGVIPGCAAKRCGHRSSLGMNSMRRMALAIFIVLGASIVISGFLTIFAARAKQGTWWRSTIIYLCLRLLRAGQKAAAFFNPSGCRADFLLFLIVWLWRRKVYYNGFFLFFIAVLLLAAGVYWLFTLAMCFKRLKEGAEKIAQGDLAYQIDKKGLFWDLSDHADTLNHIRIGISRAVEERTKSERFKAELITNVSHDIKTPLTSIINYVDFLKKEELGSEKAQEYVEVLDRQSSRLKKLTEDLVDASKAATGNIKMELAPCQVGVLLEQTIGEYEEKAENCKLKFVTSFRTRNWKLWRMDGDSGGCLIICSTISANTPNRRRGSISIWRRRTGRQSLLGGILPATN